MSFITENIFYFLLFSSVFSRAAQPGENNVTILINGLERNSTFFNEQHAKQVTVVVAKGNSSYTIDLVLNTMLLSNSFTEKVFTKNGSYIVHSNQTRDFCFYMGSVRGETEEHVAFTTCPLLKGFFTVGPSRWSVTQSNEGHWDVTVKKSTDDHKVFCGVKDVKKKIDAMLEKNPKNRRRKRSVVNGYFEDMLVVEMYLANDLSRYRQYGSSQGVFQSSKEIANVANTIYQPLGILIILVGVEVWSDRNRINVHVNSSETLKNWMSYRHTAVQTYNDVGFFLSTTKYHGSTLGLAHVGTICSERESGGIVQSIDDKSDVSGGILAHELGHNFGIVHDTQSCTCDYNSKDCIMSRRASTHIANKHFSDCSVNQMRNSLKKGLDLCLHDIPTILNHYLAVCGNGIIEEGEECDCGRLPSHSCNKACCNMENCKLKGQCAQGGCCDVASCSLRKSGHTCREAKAGSCDLPETCDGKSLFCPKDSFVQEGTECSVYDKKGSCFGGECRNRDSQCKLLYGEGAKDGDDLCYSFNRKGDVHGFCGYSLDPGSDGHHKFYSCPETDVFCGALQCDPPSDELVKFQKFLTKSKKTISNNRCTSVLMDFGKRVSSPGLVPDGAPCGEDKVCKNRRCVDRKQLLEINPCAKCVNGRCNNNGLCHCDHGFTGPSCEEIKASESSNDTALIVILCILFIILVVIIALVVYDSLNKQYIFSFFKNIANKYNKDSFNKNVRKPQKTVVENDQYNGRENPVYSIDIPQTSVVPIRQFQKPEISNPMHFYDPYNTSNRQVKEGFDNLGLKDDEAITIQKDVIRPTRPPVPKPFVPKPSVHKPFVPKPFHETNTKQLKKPSTEPPSFPKSTNYKHNIASEPPRSKIMPSRPAPPPKTDGIVAKRINRLENPKSDFSEV